MHKSNTYTGARVLVQHMHRCTCSCSTHARVHAFLCLEDVHTCQLRKEKRIIDRTEPGNRATHNRTHLEDRHVFEIAGVVQDVLQILEELAPSRFKAYALLLRLWCAQTKPSVRTCRLNACL